MMRESFEFRETFEFRFVGSPLGGSRFWVLALGFNYYIVNHQVMYREFRVSSFNLHGGYTPIRHTPWRICSSKYV